MVVMVHPSDVPAQLSGEETALKLAFFSSEYLSALS